MAIQRIISPKHMDWIKERGIFRNKEANAVGLYSRTLARLEREGTLEKLSRGVYRLQNKMMSNPDLTITASAIPKGVICLISALAFHNITTQIPRKIYVALPEHNATPRLNSLKLSIHRFRGDAYEQGIEEHTIDGINIKIYDIEKTLVDCFKFRNKLGLDVFLEALKFYRERKKMNLKAISRYAAVCRVEKQIKPFIQTIIYE